MKALVIDGYNTIHKIPRLRKIMDESLEEARRALTEMARDYQRRHGGIGKVSVVFDGRQRYDDHLIPVPDGQVFSRDEKADRKIIRLVKELSVKYRVIVVSDDNFVKNNSRAHGASVITVSGFIASQKKRKKRKKSESGHKVAPEDALAINEELKKHWRLT